jgi:hypothetical protein
MVIDTVSRGSNGVSLMPSATVPSSLTESVLLVTASAGPEQSARGPV